MNQSAQNLPSGEDVEKFYILTKHTGGTWTSVVGTDGEVMLGSERSFENAKQALERAEQTLIGHSNGALSTG